MVYISIPTYYDTYTLHTNLNNWEPIPMNKRDFLLKNYYVFYFPENEVFYLIHHHKYGYLIQEDNFISYFDDILCNYIQEVNNISNSPSLIYKKDKQLEIFELEKRIFRGEIKNGLPHGKGNIPLIYIGDFKNGSKHGKGLFFFKGKIQYDGYFQNDKYHGEGKLFFGGKIVYQGDFVNDLFHGYGKHYINKRLLYEGEFENNQYHGYGSLTRDNGKKLVGDFSLGKFMD